MPDAPSTCSLIWPRVPGSCPNDCSGHGSCRDGQCDCAPGYTYFDCSLRASPPNPSHCLLFPATLLAHPVSSVLSLSLPPTQPVLVSAGTCAGDCSGSGICFNGTCRCSDGFCGSDCSEKCCPNDCSGRGVCTQEGQAGACRCHPGFSGSDCSLRVCPNDCSGRGSCKAPPGGDACGAGARGMR